LTSSYHNLSMAHILKIFKRIRKTRSKGAYHIDIYGH